MEAQTGDLMEGRKPGDLTAVAPLPLVALSTAWVLGLALASSFALPRESLTVLLLIPLLGLLLWRRAPVHRLAFACALFAMLGTLRYPPLVTDYPLTPYLGQQVAVKGIVTSEPDAVGDEIRFRFAVFEIVAPDHGAQLMTGEVLTSAPRFSPVAYGDRTLITGTLRAAPVFAHFDYREYLARRGVHGLLQSERMTLMARDHGNPLTAALIAIRARARRAIGASLPEPHASVLQGILLGDRSDIPDALENAFRRTGTSHILVISGYNMTIVALALGGLNPRGVWSWRRTLLVLLGIAAYTLLVGAQAPVVRAALMAGVVIFGQGLNPRREGHALNSLALTVLVMTAFDPYTISDPGFLLSASATLGLILFATPIHDRIGTQIERHVSSPALRFVVGIFAGTVATTAAAQVLSLPLLIMWFGQLSVVTLLANAIILPVQALLMILGGLATLSGMLWLPLGQVVMSLPWVLLNWTIAAVEALARFPLATVALSLPAWLVSAYYATVLLASEWRSLDETLRTQLRARMKSPPARLWAAPLGLASIAVWSAVAAQPDGRLHVAFLDVGQGDAILITTPRGHQVLVDGGPQPEALMHALGKQLPFWDHGLDLVVTTHADADHFTGLITLPERYEIGAIIDNGQPPSGALGAAWSETLISSGVAHIVHASAGMRIQLESEVVLDVLSPSTAAPRGDNDRSVVLRLSWRDASFLLMADAGEEVEHALLQSGQTLRSTVVKVSHHGSATATTAEFLAAIDPQFAIISVGENRFGHPADEVLQRLSGREVLRTDQSGTIVFSTDGEVIWLQRER
jgi:competence protein ComEC